MTERYYVSDLHLDVDTPERISAFRRLLEGIKDQCDELFVLGDLTEGWIGDDDDGPLASQVRGMLGAATRDFDIFFMAGNRDFLLGQAFAKDTGIVLLDDPHLLDDGTLLCHGDSLCTDDESYQEMRLLFRSTAWKTDFLSRSLQDRRELAASLRAQSRAHNANKADNIMDVNVAAIDALAAQYEATWLIHGHTHRPGVHVHDWGHRFVLGQWERCGWRVLQSANSKPMLEAFPLHPPD